MSTENIFNKVNQQNPKDLALSKALELLTHLFDNITEFNKSELKSISLLQNDKYMKDMLTFFLLNKKHLKRKYSAEILKAFEMCSRDYNPDKSLMDKIIHRDRF